MIGKGVVLFGVQHFQKRARWIAAVVMTQFVNLIEEDDRVLLPTRFIAWMMRPGSAPMYVRRWPRISASSRTPPSEMRWKLRPSADAIERPSEVLPTPGGPTRHRIGPFLVGASLRTARYSTIRF